MGASAGTLVENSAVHQLKHSIVDASAGALVGISLVHLRKLVYQLEHLFVGASA